MCSLVALQLVAPRSRAGRHLPDAQLVQVPHILNHERFCETAPRCR
jgi:hypothetical protein